ncbi:MAG: hypothetical protein ACI4CY_07195, partial [Candidatus Gastranaerophilaceae bacterium]
MPKYSKNLNLYKTDMTTDGNDTFDFDRDLNANWDKLDTAFGELDTGADKDLSNLSDTGNAKLAGKEDVENKVGTLDASETHYPSCAAVSAALTKVNYNTRCTFNSGNVDDDGDADILHADGVQSVTETWIQPVLSANGTLGEGDFAVSPLNAGSYGTDLYKMFDGKTTRTGDNTQWVEPITADTGKGIEFYTSTAIKVGSITVVQSAYACGDFDLYGSADGQTWTQIGTGLTFPHVQYATETCAVNSN